MKAQGRRGILVAFAMAIAQLVAGSQIVAQTAPTNFFGTWELDRFKSVYDPINTMPQKQVMEFVAAQMPGQFTVTTRTWRGEVANATNYTAAADGRDYNTTAAQATVAFKLVNPTTMERTAKLMGQVSETATWSLSADRNQLTIKREGTDAAGNAYSSTALYMKVPAAAR